MASGLGFAKSAFGVFIDSKFFSFFLIQVTKLTGLSLKRGFDGCGHGFGGCDGLGRLGGFNGLRGFGGFDGLDGFDGFGGFGGFVF